MKWWSKLVDKVTGTEKVQVRARNRRAARHAREPTARYAAARRRGRSPAAARGPSRLRSDRRRGDVALPPPQLRRRCGRCRQHRFHIGLLVGVGISGAAPTQEGEEF